ncbi:MAG TPA: Nramp family divalent metal transporter [Thermoanaerobacterales bacterium]|nr:Nramp family divalent metal transporter [Thermoanaerobacterales bacterium]
MVNEELIRYPEVDERLKRGKFTDLLAFLGPGLILASASIGSGEVFFSARGGAIFQYIFLWTFLLGIIMKGVIIYSGTRYITITGEHPLTRFGEVFPGPKNWFPTLIGFFAVISFPSWASGFALFLGQWSTWVFGFGDQKIWATFWLLVVTILAFITMYDIVEKFQTGVVAIMVLFVIIAVFVSHPDWLGVLAGLVPRIPSGYEPWIIEKYPDIASKRIPLEVITYLGALGGGIYDYFGYLGLYREKKWGLLGNPNINEIQERLLMLKKSEKIPLPEDNNEEIEKAKLWSKAPLADAISSFGSVFILSAVFMILGAVILNPQHLIPTDTKIMQYQVQFFTMISPILVYLYQLGIFCAFFGTMQAVSSQLYVYTLYESFTPLLRNVKWWNINAAKIIEVLWYSGGGILLIWTGINFTTAVSFGSLIGGVLGCGIWAIAMMYIDRKMLPKAYQMSSALYTAVGISGFVMTAMGIVGVLQFFHII